MSASKKLSILALTIGAAFSTSAFAVNNTWVSSNPWGSSSFAEYAGWNSFGPASGDAAWSGNGSTNRTDSTPDFGSGGVVKETSASSFVTSGGNIYSFALPTAFTATLSGTTGSFYDVYLRIATIGTISNTSATLNGIAGVTTLAYSASGGEVFGGEATDQERFWKWSNIAGSALYTFNFSAAGSSMSLDQLQLATIALPQVIEIPTGPVSAVPEPETYAMMIAGLGLMGLVARRRSNKS